MSKTFFCTLLLIFKFKFIISENEEKDGGFRIMEGDVADKKEWPFVSVITCGQIHHCGGTIIKPSWVLTAGHCVKVPQLETQIKCLGKLSVRVGTDDMTYVNITKYLNPVCQNMKLEKAVYSAVNDNSVVEALDVFPHEKYRLQHFDVDGAPVEVVVCDIALIHLSKSFDSVPLAKLPSKSIFETNNCKVAGWGLRGTTIQIPGTKNDLQELHITLISPELCKNVLKSITGILSTPLPEEEVKSTYTNVVCGDGQTAVQTILAGDSGGPLICDGELHGIASLVMLTKDNEGKLSYSGVYTQVASYTEWINTILSENSDKEKHNAKFHKAQDFELQTKDPVVNGCIYEINYDALWIFIFVIIFLS